MIFDIAINVTDPVAIANWYVDHLEMEIVRKGEAPGHMHFLADKTGRVVIELYNNAQLIPLNYADQDPQVLHMAFAVDEMDATLTRLKAARSVQSFHNG